MATLRTTPMRVLVEDIEPVRLVAGLRRETPAEVIHNAIAEYLTNHRSELSDLHAETHRFIAAGDIDGLAATMRSDATGLAERLAQRTSRRTPVSR